MENQVQETNVSQETIEGGAIESTQVQGKMYSEEEVQERINETLQKRLARETKKIEAEKQKAYEAQLKAELEESEKLAKMSEAERIKAKADKDKKDFEARVAKYEQEMKAFEQEKILNTTMKTLGEKGLPVEFASFIKADSAEDIMENIVAFEKGFKDAVDKAVAERLKGRTPSTSIGTKSTFTADQLKNMSTEEINRNWDKIKHCKF